MDADFEERTAGRLRAEVAEVVPDDLTPPPLPELEAPYEDDDPDEEVVRIRVHTPLWPFAVAAAVAVIAVGVTIGVRPDQTPTTASPTTSSSTGTSTAPTGSVTEQVLFSVTDPVRTSSVSPNPNVFWVPMPARAARAAEILLRGFDTEGAVPDGSTVEAIDAPDSTGAPLVEASINEAGDLVVVATGMEPGAGPCQEQQELSVLESETAVAILVHRKLRPAQEGDPVVCTLIGYGFDMQVPLSAPLGDRAVLDLNRWTGQFDGPVQVTVTD